jgi:hypothetical protein
MKATKLDNGRFEVDVDGYKFQVRNFHNVDPDFTGQEIYDEDGKFVDERASNRFVDHEDQEDLMALTEYIRENLIF